MEYLKGYQIYCEAPCTLSITGSSPTNTYNLILNPGSNLIGIDITNNGKSASAAFFGIASSSIKWYNPDTDTLETVEADDTVYMGRSYWVDVSANSTYSVGILKDITTFTYDGDGGRVKKSVNGTPTIYVGSLFETNSGISTRHIFLGDTRIASVENAGGVNYYHGDHLGSTSDVTNKNGDLIQHTEYTPYGEFSPSASVTDERVTQYLFTGKLLDTSTNLYYYGARYYDPELGRFTQADTIVPDPGNPQAFNRYAYTENNPINYTDPTGHWSLKKFLHNVIAGVAAGIVAAITAPLGPAISGMFAGATYGAIMGGFEGGWKGALIGAGIGAFIGANVGLGVQHFGSAFGYAALAGGAAYTAATEGLEGLSYMAGSMMGGMIGYQAGTAMRAPPTNTITSGNANSSNTQQATQKQMHKATSSGQTQTVGDIGQSKGGIEGRMRAQEEIAANALSPSTGTGAEEAELLYSMENMANDFASEKLKWQILAKSKEFYFSLTVSERPSDAVLVIDWPAQEVTDIYKLQNCDAILYNKGSNYILQHVPYEAMEKTFSQ